MKLGNQIWVTSDGILNHPESPQYLTTLGLPGDINRLDAAFVWGKNSKTYIFHNNMYWRYDEVQGKMDDGYPKGTKLNISLHTYCLRLVISSMEVLLFNF